MLSQSAQHQVAADGVAPLGVKPSACKTTTKFGLRYIRDRYWKTTILSPEYEVTQTHYADKNSSRFVKFKYCCNSRRISLYDKLS